MAKTKLNRLSTPKGRLSYPCLETARAPQDGGKANYSATLIFDKAAQATDAYKALVEDVRRVALAEFGAAEIEKLRNLQAKQPAKKIWSEPFRDGNQKLDDEGNVEPAYAGGMTYIAARTEFDDVKKNYFDATGAKIESAVLYPGCYARLRVTAHAWTHPTGGAGVSFWLYGAQFLEDGERLGGGGMSASEFDAVPNAKPAAAPFPGAEDESLPF